MTNSSVKPKHLISLLEDATQNLGTQPALIFGDESLSYAELEARSNQLAHALQERGVQRNSIVGICLERSFDMIVALLGILKAGGAYLPLDPEYPRDRLQFMLEDSRATVLLTHQSIAELLPSSRVRTIFLDKARDEISAQSPLPMPMRGESEDLAYVIYTSGSTGTPKGVAMVHQALVNLIEWQLSDSAVGEQERTLQFTPLSFDVSFQEIFATLCARGQLVLVPHEKRLDPSALWNYLAEAHIARLFLPFVALQQLAEASRHRSAAPQALKEVITAGEQLQVTDALIHMFTGLPECSLFNHYGPSETHVVTRLRLAGPASRWPRLPSIGTPLPNVQTLILNEQLRQAASPGETGELYLGGICLAQGYLHRPELTAERFLDSCEGYGARLYKTGDLARWLPDGNIEFLGRADGQIKIRGYRIEPGEVEVALLRHPEVARAAVAPKTNLSGTPRLIAYVVGQPGKDAPSSAELRRFLGERLPDHMIPSAFLTLPALPTTPSGKLDRKQLPDPSRHRPILDQPVEAPANPMEVALCSVWSELLELEGVGVKDNFFDLGGNSLLCVQMTQRLRERLGLDVPVAVPFQRPTIRSLLAYLDDQGASDPRQKAKLRAERLGVGSSAHAARTSDVAVIGMAVRFPGCDTPENYWDLLRAGVNAVRELTLEELRSSGQPDELINDPCYVRAKGLIEDPESLDAAFFAMNPREARLMDPQHRVFLEACWQALEHSGHAPNQTEGNVGVWGGVSTGMRNSTYLLRVLYAQPDALSSEEQMTAMLGNANDYVATRVAHKLNLHGPSVSVQTACSTSLTAIAHAYESLVNHQCDMALAGGASVLFPRREGYLYQDGDIGSSDGCCRPFDAKADGTVFSEGVGVVVLKRLADAIADKNTIYAIVKGVGINNDGGSKMSFSAPSAEGQAEAIAVAHAMARVHPSTIQFVEGHGTGTPLGDPIEVSGLAQAFGDCPAHSCALGSVKGNFGHMIAAAGVAAFTKAALSLYHQQIPGTVHFRSPNPQLDIGRTPFYVNSEIIDWPATDSPRRAGVSAFGLGGTNVHMVLEQGPDPAGQRAAPTPSPPHCLLPLSAKSASALKTMGTALRLHMERHPELELADIAFTLQHGRSPFAHREFVVAPTTEGAALSLRTGPPSTQIRFERPSSPSVAFMFPGGGAQYVAMGAGLYRSSPVFAQVVDQGLGFCDEVGATKVRSMWFRERAIDNPRPPEFERPTLQLPAIYIIEVALGELWRSVGVTPSVAIGHSMGEYAAAHLAGCFTFEDGLKLVLLRAELFEQLPEGGMLSVGLSEHELLPLLGDELDLAVVNGPDLCIASGPKSALVSLAERLRADDIEAQMVQISVAAHSRMVDPILERFRSLLDSVSLKPPSLPIASNRTGRWLTNEEACSSTYWVDHLRHAVRFHDGLSLLANDTSRLFLEVGPGRTLSSLARPHVSLKAGQCVVSSLRHANEAVPDDAFFLQSAGQLWLSGIEIAWGALLPSEGRKRVALPTYPFERKRFYYGPGPAATQPTPSAQAASPSPADGTPNPSHSWLPYHTPTAGILTQPSQFDPGLIQQALGMLPGQVAPSTAVSAPAAAPPFNPTPPLETELALPSFPAPISGPNQEELMTRPDAIASKLANILCELAGLEPADVSSNRPFVEMGFDSLFLTQVCLAFKRAFKVKITFRQLFDEAPTLSALAEHIHRQLPANIEVAGAQPSATVPVAAPATESPSRAVPSPAPSATAPAVALPAFAPSAYAPPSCRVPEVTVPYGANSIAPAVALQLAIAQQLSAAAALLTSLQGFQSGVSAVPTAHAQPPLQPVTTPGPTVSDPSHSAAPPDSIPALASSGTAAGAPQQSADGEQLTTDGAIQLTDVPMRFGPYKPIQKGPDGGLTATQQTHLNELISRVLQRCPKSKALTARHRKHFADPRAVGGFKTLWKEIVFPIGSERSKGSRMWDLDGNEYIDCVGGFGATFFGHAPDFVVEAVSRQLHQSLDYGPTSPKAGEIARRLCEYTGMERASFCNTGSEAVLACMRTARTVTGRDLIVTFTGDYHGIFDEVLVRSKQVGNARRNVPIAPGIPRSASSNMVVLEYGDPASLDRIRELAADLAGVLVEPVQSRAPDLQPREFVIALRELTRELEIPLIFDEIITGFRSHPRGAQGFYGVRADIAAYGKVIGGGMPIGVIAGKSVYLDALDGGTWNYGDKSFPEAGVTYFAGTFVRHPLALAAVEAVLDYMDQQGPALQERVNHQCAALAAQLNDFFELERIPIRMLHFASVILLKWGGDPEYEGLYHQHLRSLGVHIWEGRPGFMTTAHTDADYLQLQERFKKAALSMVEGGFLNRLESQDEVKATQSVPLTEPQRELWLTTQVSEAASKSLNEPCAFELRGRLNTPVLQRALRLVVLRHDALRATPSLNGESLVIHPVVGEVRIETVDLSSFSPDERSPVRENLYRTDSRELFDLKQPPLLRAKLLKLADDHYELLLTVHHIVCDGWSINIVASDLARLYTSLLEGRSVALPAPMQLGAYAAWAAAEQKTDEAHATLKFWQERYRTIPAPVELPVDRPRPAQRTYNGNRIHTTISASVGSAIKEYGAKHKCTLFTVLLAAYSAMLSRLTQSHDIPIGIPSAGQALLGANNLVAHCVNYLPFRAIIDPSASFEAHLESTRTAMLDANENQHFTYGSLLQSIRLPRDPSRPTLVSLDFNVDPGMSDLEFSGLDVQYVSTPRDFARLELQFNIIESEGKLLLECDYAEDFIDEATARRWMSCYEAVLKSIIAEPQTTIAQLELLSAAERTRVVDEWNDTRLDSNDRALVHELFERCADRSPHAVAICYENHSLSYEELDRRANRVAHRILKLGVADNALIGICVPRGIEMVVGLLGILKAGCAYVPMDPAYPSNRLAYMVKDSGVSVLMTTRACSKALGELGPQRLWLDEAESDPMAPESRATVDISRDALAYVVYTSGSTGDPKGVMVEHKSVVSFIAGMSKFLEPGDRGVWLAGTSISFDISVLEIFGTLASGFQVVIAGDVHTGAAESTSELIERHRVTHYQCTPTQARVLLTDKQGASALAKLERLLVGGEALAPELARELNGALTRGTLDNMYGPTETTVWSTTCEINSNAERITIGKPIANTRVYILDSDGNATPIGVPGELTIGGAGVARGYLGRSDLTQERFVPDKFARNGALMYRTGDLARWTNEGTLEFLGRNDSQVKVRGYRIELGEIESALSRIPNVSQAAVAVRSDRHGDPILVAYFLSNLSQLPARELREGLRDQLPAHMIPQAFVQLDAFPTTPNGKLNRKALPAYESGSVKESASTEVPPTSTQKLLIELWEDLLGARGLSGESDFFDLGGHSLLAARMLARLEEHSGIHLGLQVIFSAPTINELAAAVDAGLYLKHVQRTVSSDSAREEFEI